MNNEHSDMRMDLDTINNLIENHMRIERAMNGSKELIERCLEEYYEFGLKAYTEIEDFRTKIIGEAGIKIVRQDETLILHVESVMPKRKDFQRNHTAVLIDDALALYSRNNIEIMEDYPLQDALMVFEYCYPCEAKIIMDHDNYMLKNIVDSFVPDFVASDNGFALKMLHISRYTNNEVSFTNIYLLPFANSDEWIRRWRENHKMRPESGTHFTESFGTQFFK